MDSLDLSMESVESLDKVHGYSGQIPGSPLRLDNVHGLSGHYPLSPWTMSMDSLGNVLGLSGKSGVWTIFMDTLDKIQVDHSDWTMLHSGSVLSCLSRFRPPRDQLRIDPSVYMDIIGLTQAFASV